MELKIVQPAKSSERRAELSRAILGKRRGPAMPSDEARFMPDINRIPDGNRREHGVQIEHSIDARKIHGRRMADAVADVIGPMIKVCTAPVFERSNPWTCLTR